MTNVTCVSEIEGSYTLYRFNRIQLNDPSYTLYIYTRKEWDMPRFEAKIYNQIGCDLSFSEDVLFGKKCSVSLLKTRDPLERDIEEALIEALLPQLGLTAVIQPNGRLRLTSNAKEKHKFVFEKTKLFN